MKLEFRRWKQEAVWFILSLSGLTFPRSLFKKNIFIELKWISARRDLANITAATPETGLQLPASAPPAIWHSTSRYSHYRFMFMSVSVLSVKYGNHFLLSSHILALLVLPFLPLFLPFIYIFFFCVSPFTPPTFKQITSPLLLSSPVSSFDLLHFVLPLSLSLFLGGQKVRKKRKSVSRPHLSPSSPPPPLFFLYFSHLPTSWLMPVFFLHTLHPLLLLVSFLVWSPGDDAGPTGTFWMNIKLECQQVKLQFQFGGVRLYILSTDAVIKWKKYKTRHCKQ